MKPDSEKPDEKREHGTGTVEQVGGGMWRFRCPDGAGGRYTSPSEYPTEALAQDGLDRFRRMVANREIVPTRGLSLKDHWEQHFLPETIRLRRPGTVQMYKTRWKRIEKAPFARKPMVSIRRREIRDWLKSLKVTRPDNFLAAVHAILETAVAEDRLESNPASSITVELPERDADDLRPTPEEQEKILACVQIPKADKLIIMFALGAGLRPGEWRNLELDDVHLEEPVPYVFVQFGSDGRGKTKTGKKRRVPLVGMAHRALVAWMEQLPTFAPRNPMRLVFPQASGERRSADSPFGRVGPRKARRGRWHAFLRAAGIRRRLTPHSLRHGCATDLLTGARGERFEAWQVQVFLGHDQLTTTMKYLHPGERDLFAHLAKRSTNGPRPSGPDPKTPAIPGTSGTKTRVAEETGFEPRTSPPLALVDDSQPENDPQWTGRGLTARATEIFERLAEGWRPTEAEATALARELAGLRAAEDRVLVAAARVGGKTYLSALVELLDLVVPDAAGVDVRRVT